MTHSGIQGSGFALWTIEASLTAIAIPLAFLFPRLGGTWPSRVMSSFRQLARRRAVAVAVVAATMFLLRLALLPLFPPPLPYSTDDFSFLLAADTFLHGRLTNPTPAMWMHFESIHITMQPSYMSMYFPGPGLLMAAGQLIFGHPWAGILITAALTCGAICWMLQAWLPPTWALLGGFLAILRIGLFSYWTNTYTGGATLSALGGALVLGSLPRLRKRARLRDGMLMATGMALLMLSRPYEGVLLCLPVTLALGHWILFAKNRPSKMVLLRRAAAPIVLLLLLLFWMGYYDARVFGKATTLPYTIARAQYAVVPYYIWQPTPATPHYRHPEMGRFYTESETVGYKKLRAPGGFLPYNLSKLINATLFFAGLALLPPLVFARGVLHDRRIRFLIWSLPAWAIGLAVGVFLIPHYLAPFTAGFYALGLQAMRHLWVWKPSGQPVGRTLGRLLVLICVLMAALRTVANPLAIEPPQWPIPAWLCTWYGPGHFGTQRAEVAATLDKLPGKHLVFVRYSPKHEPGDEWVYNAADIDGSKTIWAREMNPTADAELIHHYKDRDIWLAQPDVAQAPLARYTSAR